MRQILNLSDRDFVSLQEELKSLRLYLDLEALRFEHKFEIDINIDPSLALSKIEIPPMIIQPYLENAIVHGLLPKKENGKLSLTLSQDKPTLLKCSIEDNGIGRAAAAKNKQQKYSHHHSFATNATASRLNLLNKVYKNKIGIVIQDKEENGIAQGTKVMLTIPIKT